MNERLGRLDDAGRRGSTRIWELTGRAARATSDRARASCSPACSTCRAASRSRRSMPSASRCCALPAGSRGAAGIRGDGRGARPPTLLRACPGRQMRGAGGRAAPQDAGRCPGFGGSAHLDERVRRADEQASAATRLAAVAHRRRGRRCNACGPSWLRRWAAGPTIPPASSSPCLPGRRRSTSAGLRARREALRRGGKKDVGARRHDRRLAGRRRGSSAPSGALSRGLLHRQGRDPQAPDHQGRHPGAGRTSRRCSSARPSAWALALDRIAARRWSIARSRCCGSATSLSRYAAPSAPRRPRLRRPDRRARAACWRAPESAPWVLYKLDGGLDHILIDEAQDTNPDQWEVIRRAGRGVLRRRRRRRAQPHGVRGRRPQAVDLQLPARRSAQAARRCASDFQAAFAAPSRSSGGRPQCLVPLDAGRARRGRRVFAQAEAAHGVAGRQRRPSCPAARTSRAGRALAAGRAAEDEPTRPAWAPPVAPKGRRSRAPRLARPSPRRQRLDRHGERRWRRRPVAARRRRHGAGAPAQRVRRRPGARAEARRRPGRRRRPAGPGRGARGAGPGGAGALRAAAGGRSRPSPTVLKGPLFGLSEDELFVLAWQRTGLLWAALRERAGRAVLRRGVADGCSRLLPAPISCRPFELLRHLLGADGGRAAPARAARAPRRPTRSTSFWRWRCSYEPSTPPSCRASCAGSRRAAARSSATSTRSRRRRGAHPDRARRQGPAGADRFLPDTMRVPRDAERSAARDRRRDALWVPRADDANDGAPGCWRGKSRDRAREEQNRLLYVALTRAEDRLYVCGWYGARKPDRGCWYERIEAGLRASSETEVSSDSAQPRGRAEARTFDFAATELLGSDGWQATATSSPTPARSACPSSSSWRSRPPRRCRPGRASLRRPNPIHRRRSRRRSRCPTRRWPGRAPSARWRRAIPSAGSAATLIHACCSHLPATPAAERAEAARRFLAQPAHGLSRRGERRLERARRSPS